MKLLWPFALLVFIGGCCFGILSTFVKLAYSAGFSLASVTGSQFLCGFLLIWLVIPFTKRKKLSRKLILFLIGSGIPMGLTGVLYYQSLQTVDASLAIIFLFQFVWIGSLLEWIIDKKKPSMKNVTAIIILLFGSILAGGFLLESTTFNWNGLLFGLMAAFTFSMFIYLSGKIGADVPPIQKSALLTTGGFATVILIFSSQVNFSLSMDTVLGVAPFGLILGFFGVFLPPILFSIGMPRVGGGVGTILTSSELPVAVVMSTLVLNEVVYVSQWLGVILILLGIAVGNGLLLFNRRRTREHQTI